MDKARQNPRQYLDSDLFMGNQLGIGGVIPIRRETLDLREEELMENWALHSSLNLSAFAQEPVCSVWLFSHGFQMRQRPCKGSSFSPF